jgi:hypothetical protein
MSLKKWIGIFLIIPLAACQLAKDTSYKVPTNGATGSLFIYMPDTKQKNTDAVSISIDNLSAGEMAENRPLQLSAAIGWHKVAVRRLSTLGAREELAKFDILIEKDTIYYVRYAKTTDATVSVLVGSSTFGVVDENTGRQMR